MSAGSLSADRKAILSWRHNGLYKESLRIMSISGIAKRTAFLSFVFCFVLPVPLALSAPEVTTKNNYFYVPGATELEITKNLEHHARKDANWGNFFWAKNIWSTNWHIWWRETEKGCVLSRVDSSVEFENWIPRWRHKSEATPEMRARLRRTSAAIDLYREQIMSSGVSSVTEIGQLYTRFPAFKTCEELKDAFHKQATRISQLYRDSAAAIAKRTGNGTRLFPDLNEPAGPETPVPGSPDLELDGWCQISDDRETVETLMCRYDRSCEPDTARCRIDFSWPEERVQVQYFDGGPVRWNDELADFAFINKAPCVRRVSDSRILCFSEAEPKQRWFYHLP